MKVELKNINKSFGKIKIFSNYNLCIDSGSMVGIYGESGSGKTTLLNIIGGIEQCTSGEIYLDDTQVTKRNIKSFWRKDISFIFQNYGVVDNYTVLENIKLLYNFKSLTAHNEIEDSLNVLGLSHKRDSKVYELSGGQQQRIALVKTRIKKAKLILADEPTASVDEMNKEIILTELRSLNKLGATVIIVSHDQSVLQKCDNIIKL